MAVRLPYWSHFQPTTFSLLKFSKVNARVSHWKISLLDYKTNMFCTENDHVFTTQLPICQWQRLVQIAFNYLVLEFENVPLKQIKCIRLLKICSKVHLFVHSPAQHYDWRSLTKLMLIWTKKQNRRQIANTQFTTTFGLYKLKIKSRKLISLTWVDLQYTCNAFTTGRRM